MSCGLHLRDVVWNGVQGGGGGAGRGGTTRGRECQWQSDATQGRRRSARRRGRCGCRGHGAQEHVSCQGHAPHPQLQYRAQDAQDLRRLGEGQKAGRKNEGEEGEGNGERGVSVRTGSHGERCEGSVALFLSQVCRGGARQNGRSIVDGVHGGADRLVRRREREAESRRSLLHINSLTLIRP